MGVVGVTADARMHINWWFCGVSQLGRESSFGLCANGFVDDRSRGRVVRRASA
jgi:hypothetical protein